MNDVIMGIYTPINLCGLFIQSVCIENFVLANFLGMCSFLSCSTRVRTAHGLGLAVIFVLAVSGVLNWCVHRYVTAPGALIWLLGPEGAQGIDLSFLEFLIFISVIAAFTQVTEIVIENSSPHLYRALGIFLPLIAVNCAVLGASLFAVMRSYPLIPCIVYMCGSGVGWWLAIVLMAAIREKLSYANPPQGFGGTAIIFVMSGLMSLGFMGFSGMKLAQPATQVTARQSHQQEVIAKAFSQPSDSQAP